MSERADRIAINLVQGSQPKLEEDLRGVFATAAAAESRPIAVAAAAARAIGQGTLVTVEAEKGPWTRYRVAIRVQGMPVTIGTVEVTER